VISYDVFQGGSSTSVPAVSGVYSSQHVASVPEPESYAMLLAGLGALGFMARRRKSNSV
jgi:hypothetical protein